MSTPLRDLITAVAFDEPTRAAFTADPAGFLDDHGWSDLDGVDVSTALGALVGELPIEQADALHSVALNADAFGGGLDGAILGLGAAASALGESPDHDGIADPTAGVDGPPLDASSDPADLDAEVDDPALSLDDEATEHGADAGHAELAEAAHGDDAEPPERESEPGLATADAHGADALEELDGEAHAGDVFPDAADTVEDPLTFDDIDDDGAVDGFDGHDGIVGADDADDVDDADDAGFGEF